MTTAEWAPFGLSDDETSQYRVLADGVPQKLREPLIAWLRPALASSDYPYWVITARTRELEMRTEVRMGLAEQSHLDWKAYTELLRKMPPEKLLRVVDAVLSSGWYGIRVDELNKTLTLAKSKWMVGERMGKPGLVAREPEGVQDMVEDTIKNSGTAGQILARAWGKVHALEPDNPGAYADAVRAVEAAAKPLVEPDNDEATLGSMAGVMRNHGDWRLPLREHQHAPTGQMMVAMMRSLYRGHVDRHGRDDYRDVTHEEARAGVALAATLVSWFALGVVQRRPEVD
ncbi:hypothetical protein [Nocardioides sp. zg-DK7169]|uniref:hypothetical protein n=1 Tax=Nocardioides sp. zg-DK7169 TaxID=2736600 RepID=UPI0015568895|nr:hypothetical protein [Nocardioides sp. zg-DK7169]NPC97893.1 hypothetical protein [Nocardioides sp. zg-DK7169]